MSNTAYVLKMWCVNDPSIVLYFGYFRERNDAIREVRVKLAFEKARASPLSKEKDDLLCDPDDWEYDIEDDFPEGNYRKNSPYISIKRAVLST